MNLFSRYMFAQLAGALTLILLSLTGVVWIATALSQLKLLTAQGQGGLTFFKITLLAMPNLIAIIAPIAMLIACIHVLNRMNGDSELIVMTASGAPVWAFAKPLIALALIVSMLLAVAEFYVLPWSLKTLRDFVVKVRTDLIQQVIRPGAFTTPERGLTFHIRARSRDGTLHGLIMDDQRQSGQVLSYLAERGTIVKKDRSAFLIMHNGDIVRRTAKDGPPRIIRFDRYVIDLARMAPKSSEKIHYKPKELNLDELWNPDPDNIFYKAKPGKFRSTLHARISSPLYPIAFALIVLASVGQAQSHRQGRTYSVVNAFALSALVRMGGLAATNLLTLKAWAVVLVYGIPVSAIIVAAIVAHMRMRPRKKSRFARFVERTYDGVKLRLLRLFAGQGAESRGNAA